MTTHILILGASGQLARNTTPVFLRNSDAKLTLYLRRVLPEERLSPGSQVAETQAP